MTPHEFALLTRTDLPTMIEQRPWIAAELRDENNRNPMTTLGDVLRGRYEISRRHVVRWERGRKVSLPQKAPRGTEGRPGFDSPRLHPDLDAEEAWHPSHLNLVVDPLIGRLKVPARYRKDESDR